MVCYISFSIDGRDLMIHEDNPNDIKMWKTHGRGKLKKPYWKQVTIKKNLKYKQVRISQKIYYLHRVNYFAHNQSWNIHDSSKNNYIDHEDKNKMNNNIENLRVVTHQENCFNRNAKGCHYYYGKWRVYIRVKGNKKYIGTFDLEEDAHQAYLTAKKIYHTIQIRK